MSEYLFKNILNSREHWFDSAINHHLGEHILVYIYFITSFSHHREFLYDETWDRHADYYMAPVQDYYVGFTL